MTVSEWVEALNWWFETYPDRPLPSWASRLTYAMIKQELLEVIMEEFRVTYPDKWENKKGECTDLVCATCNPTGFLGWRVNDTKPLEIHMVHDFAVIRGKMYCREHAVPA